MIVIFQRRADLDVAAADIDLRIDRRNLADKRLILEGIDLHGYRLPEADLIGRLLRHEEIRIDWIERLQRHDHCTGTEILSEVDGANAEMTGKGRA